MSEVFKTERLILRPVHMDDAEAIAATLDDLDVCKWLTVVPHPYSLDDAVNFIAVAQNQFPKHAAIEINGQFAGMISTAGKLGYWLCKPFWGQGYVLEAARVAVDRYFFEPGRTELGSGYILGNNRSRKILEILGFTNVHANKIIPASTKVETEHQVLTLTRARWEAQQ